MFFGIWLSLIANIVISCASHIPIVIMLSMFSYNLSILLIWNYEAMLEA